MKIHHNKTLCAFFGECTEAAPDVFGWAPDDSLLIQKPTPEQLENVREAVRVCPSAALRLEEDAE